MATKVKFPLKMADGAQVRTLEDLRKHFDLISVLAYYDSGRLHDWLTVYYFNEEAEKIKALNSSADDFKKSLCDILGVTYAEDESVDVDLSDISERNERLAKLRTFTADDKILVAVDSVAFSQQELYTLLYSGNTKIYLCGERFVIPDSIGVTYIGVNNPVVDAPDGYSAKNIVFQNVKLSGVNDVIWRAENTANTNEAAALWRMAAEQGSAEAQYRLGVCLYKGKGVEQDYIEAIKWIRKAADQNYIKAKKAFIHNGQLFNNFQTCISADGPFGLKNDGTVIGGSSSAHDIFEWRNIIAVFSSDESTGFVGLKSDGTLMISGFSEDTLRSIQNWKDVVDVAISVRYIFGLKADGTVLVPDEETTFGINSELLTAIESWRDIIAIEIIDGRAFGLKADNTVVFAGEEYIPSKIFDYPPIINVQNWQGWHDIIAISAGATKRVGGFVEGYHIVGLKSDGTVIAYGVGDNNKKLCSTQDWSDIIAISTSSTYTVGLKSNGTVVAVAGHYYEDSCDVKDWKGIIAVSAGTGQILGLTKDGTVLECEIYDSELSDWDNIGLVLTESDFLGSRVKNENIREVINKIIHAVGGESNLSWGSPISIEMSTGNIVISVRDRHIVDKVELNKLSITDVEVEVEYKTETIYPETEGNYTNGNNKLTIGGLFRIVKDSARESFIDPKQVTTDEGWGKVYIKLENVDLSFRTELVSILGDKCSFSE